MWAQTVDQWHKDQVSELGKTLSKLYCYITVLCFPELFPEEVLQRYNKHCNQGFCFSFALEKYVAGKGRGETYYCCCARKHGNGVKHGKPVVSGLSERMTKANTSPQLDCFANERLFPLNFAEALSTTDIPKLQTKVVDAIPPEVVEDMSVSQLQVKTFIVKIHV